MPLDIKELISVYERGLRSNGDIDKDSIPERLIPFKEFLTDLTNRTPMNHVKAHTYLRINTELYGFNQEQNQEMKDAIDNTVNISEDPVNSERILFSLRTNINGEYTFIYRGIILSLKHYDGILQNAMIDYDTRERILNNVKNFLYDILIYKIVINHTQAVNFTNEISGFMTPGINDKLTEELDDLESRAETQPQVESSYDLPFIIGINARIHTVKKIKTPFKNLKSNPKSIIRSSESGLAESSFACIQLVGEFETPFVRLGNKLKKACTAYTQECKSLNRIKTRLTTHIEPYQVKNFDKRLIIANVNPKNVTDALFTKWKESPKFMLYKINSENFDITYSVGKGIGEGVIRDFFQKLIYEFIANKIFIPNSDDEPVKKYFINPALKVDLNFYKFIGNCLGMIVLNDIGLNFDLSHIILARMLYKKEEITDDDYITYAMLDFPRDFTMNIGNLMKYPDVIDDLELTFNSQYELFKDSRGKESVNKNNFKEYAIRRSKYRLLQNAEKQFNALVSGFQVIRKLLSHEKVNMPQLQNLITFQKIDKKTIQLLVDNFTTSMTVKNKLYENMLSILEDDGKTFPKLGSKSVSNKKEMFYQFIEDLLLFWSSYRHYINSFRYVIEMVKTGDNIMSHTCYTNIYIPANLAENRDELYKALVMTVMGGSGREGFSLA